LDERERDDGVDGRAVWRRIEICFRISKLETKKCKLGIWDGAGGMEA